MTARRRTRTGLVLACCIAAVLAVTPPAAAVTATPVFGGRFETLPMSVGGSYVPIPLFCGGPPDILWYGKGRAPDAWWRDIDTLGASITYTNWELFVSGDYEPFAGDFDGDGCDDVMWYAPGPAPDFVWYFAADKSYEQVRITVNGDYQPLVGFYDPVDNHQDIYWYAPGSVAESIWLGNADRTFTPAAAPQVNGTYRPVVWGFSEVLWHAPGPAPDYVTTVLAGSTSPSVSTRTTINGTYQPFTVGREPVLYAPGPAPDFVVTGLGTTQPDGSTPLTTTPGAINGTFVAGVGARVELTVLHAPGPAPDYLLGS